VLAPVLAIPSVFPRQIASAELTCCSGCGAESPCHWERLPQARLASPARAVFDAFPNFPRSAHCLRCFVHKLSLHTALGGYSASDLPDDASLMFMKPPCDEAVIRSVSPDATCAAKAEPWILAAAVLGSSMAFVDSSVLNGRFSPRVPTFWVTASQLTSSPFFIPNPVLRRWAVFVS
jgi:hypothetical protein